MLAVSINKLVGSGALVAASTHTLALIDLAASVSLRWNSPKLMPITFAAAKFGVTEV